MKQTVQPTTQSSPLFSVFVFPITGGRYSLQIKFIIYMMNCLFSGKRTKTADRLMNLMHCNPPIMK